MPPQSRNGFSPKRDRKRSSVPAARQYGTQDRRRTNPQFLQGDLRVAYQAQTNKKSNSNGFSTMFDNNDQHSTSGGSAANSAATPSSVYMPSSIALSRDMSDLSGFSGGTHRGSSSHTIPGQILDPKSLFRPWKQAYNLSNVPPERNKHLSSHSVTGQDQNYNANHSNTNGTSIWVAQNDVVEIFDNLDSSLGLDRFRILGGKHNRIPVLIILMDPSKHSYELMQIWVDRAIDSVRNLVQALQHKLPVKWKQAYDGLFQVRGHRFTQLINIIRLAKYDIQPYEILVAKPWSMTAKVTIAIAGSAIRHLTRIGVITTDIDEASSSDKERKYHQPQQLRNEDAPLLLSKRAQDRAYFPEGILNHHHAIQFITFSPPFESNQINDTAENAELAGAATSNNSSTFHKPNSKSECQEGAYSSLLGSNRAGKGSPGKVSPGVRRVNPCPLSRRQKSSPSLHRTCQKDSDGAKSKYSTAFDDSNEKATNFGRGKQERETSSGHSRCFSKLNCLRTSRDDPSFETRKIDTMLNPKVSQETTIASLSKEEEKRWLAYSMKPIDEDQSLATGSIVSMSAPLLSPSSTKLPLVNDKSRSNQTFLSPEQSAVGSSNLGRKIYNPMRNSRNRAIDIECEL